MTSITWQDGLQRLLRRVDATGEHVTDGFPHYGDPVTGRWTTSPGGDWTGGFWNGMCWLAAHSTGEARYRHWAQQWTERLRPRAHSDTIFRGFLFYYGALGGTSYWRGDDWSAMASLAFWSEARGEGMLARGYRGSQQVGQDKERS